MSKTGKFRIFNLKEEQDIVNSYLELKSLPKVQIKHKIGGINLTKILDKYKINHSFPKKFNLEGNKYCNFCKLYINPSIFGASNYNCLPCQRIKGKNKRLKSIGKVTYSEKIKNPKIKEALKIAQKKYKLKNKEEIQKRIRIWKKNKIIENPSYVLHNNIRSLISNAFIKNNSHKNSKTVEILGCSIKEFKNHIESKWENWMNWDNYGKIPKIINERWELDHIIPISTAKTEKDIIKLNHYTNFQPLCSYTNRFIKRNKLNYLK